MLLKNQTLIIKYTFIVIVFFQTITSVAQVWQPDLGDGYYKNPIIHADYSDPDILRVGEDFYMVASSFNSAPGLPILHSTDLIHWEIINHVFQRQMPDSTFSKPQHGNGAWAPSFRFHDGFYYIFYGDPDFGIYMSKTKDPSGKWLPPLLIKAAKGWIDPCPFWDEDGKAYLVHAFAGSRSSIKSVLVVNEMKPDGSELLDDGVLVFDGHQNHTTIEGPKFYKRNGYYYIFAPAGGVPTGWQTVLRSKNIYGPYEDKIVLHQGKTDINGPHQGGWVSLENGEYWFVHFQDKNAYGRIVHLQPMTWTDDNWCIIGKDEDGDGIGEPVDKFKKPNLKNNKGNTIPQTSDEFDANTLGLQWQWHANPFPTWGFPQGSKGKFRLYAHEIPGESNNLWAAGNLLLQKFPALEFSATTQVEFFPSDKENLTEKMGLLIMGIDYSYLALENQNGQMSLLQVVCKNAEKGGEEKVMKRISFNATSIYFKVTVKADGICQFSYSKDGKDFTDFGEKFTAKEGKWIGAKVGLFGTRSGKTNDSGYADFDFFRITD
ncbi:MAG: glycoside hydrolase 43 family protein [Chitinophagales bacterium]